MTKKFSMQGWQLKEWLRGNKESVKLTIAALLAYAAWGADLIPDAEVRALTVALVGAVSKLCLDAFDYWLKQ